MPTNQHATAASVAPHSAGGVPVYEEIANPAALADQEAEIEAARLTMPYMAQLQRMHGSWMAAFDDSETDEASLPDLLDLLKSAPTEFARGLVYGKLSMRAQERAQEHARIAL